MGSRDKGIVSGKRERDAEEGLRILKERYPDSKASVEWISGKNHKRWLVTLRTPNGTIRKYVDKINPPPYDLLKTESKLRAQGMEGW